MGWNSLLRASHGRFLLVIRVSVHSITPSKRSSLTTQYQVGPTHVTSSSSSSLLHDTFLFTIKLCFTPTEYKHNEVKLY